ncbi:TonB-dependent receptor [Eilatimonas milleporae]|uniref:Iron complex outermembrane receptor protein n=1 Tax=Eilatimonas milleporae TaxID=911205 RepID=A0A3M0CXJ5_9PROT|nr:TonB-dependent receptor [Eilatimonas milleporae]RMB12256.1 iron complex outermembrane receptor protein [Eilatimonas milleporae]
MNMQRRLLTSALALATAGAVSAGASAQDGQSSQESNVDFSLEEVVVTAQRRIETVQDVPIAVSAFSANDLSNRQVFDTKDLLQFVPNVFVDNNTGLGTANTFFIRGLGNTESVATFDPPVGTYVDDVFIARQNANNFALFDVERVEVLRGPQGTLFGRNTTGGAVNVVLAKPREEFGGFAEIGYGRFDRVMARASVDVPINDRILTKFSGYYMTDDGFVTNTTTGERLNDQEAFGLRAAAQIKLNETATWDISVDYSEDDFANILNTEDPETGRRVSSSGFSKNEPSPLSGLLTGFKGTLPHGNRIEAANVTSRFTLDLEDSTLEIITGYRDLNQDFAIDFFNGPAEFGGFTIANQGKHNQFTQEIKLDGSLADGKLDYVAGFFYFKDDNFTDFGDVFALNLPTGTIPLVLADRIIENDTEALALYAQVDYNITEEFTFTAGIRYTDETKDFSIDDNRPGGNLNDVSLEQEGIPLEQVAKKWTPRFALQYTPNDDMMFFASATRGFKSGGWNARGTTPDELLPFGPETVWSYEGGLRSEWFDNRLRFNATAFYTDVTDFQTPAAFPRDNGALAFLTRNFADLEVKGIELELTAVPTDGLTIFTTLGLQDAEQTPDADAPPFDEFGVRSVLQQQADCLAGDQSACGQGIVLADGSIADPTRAPDVTLAAGFTYEHPIGPDGGRLITNASGIYVTEHCITTDCDEVNLPFTFADDRILVNAGVGYQAPDDRWGIFLECNNCFEAEYNTAVLGFPYLNEPMRWMLRLTTRFGGV